MNIKTGLTAIVLMCCTNRFMLYGRAGGTTASEKVYYGEVVEKTKEAITLNVTPCGNRKTPQTFSPYEILSSQETSCSDGKSYIRVAVREHESPTPSPTPLDPNAETDKKRPPTQPDKKKDKPADEAPPDSSDRGGQQL